MGSEQEAERGGNRRKLAEAAPDRGGLPAPRNPGNWWEMLQTGATTRQGAEPGSNRRHQDFQARCLGRGLPGKCGISRGFFAVRIVEIGHPAPTIGSVSCITCTAATQGAWE